MNIEQARAALRAAGVDAAGELMAPSIRLVPQIDHSRYPHPRPSEGRPCRQCRRVEPTEYASPGPYVAVAAGRDFSLALAADGAVHAWGANDYGQLGDGTTRYRASPAVVHRIEGKVRAIAAGNAHALALTDGGAVVSWGWNFHGQLGTGTREDRSRPRPVVGLPAAAIAIAAAQHHSLALLENGEVMAWGGGWGEPLQLGDGEAKARTAPVTVAGLSDVAAIAAGEHNFALDVGGRAWAWGRNWRGALGDGTTTDRPTPVHVSVLPQPPAALVPGSSHSLALIEGKAWGWGNNYNHQLGDGSEPERSCPRPIGGIPTRVAALAASGYTLVLGEDGSVWACGQNFDGQAGNGAVGLQSDLQEVRGLGGPVKAIAAGNSHALALREDGALIGWGGAHPPFESDQDPDLPPAASKLGGRADLPEETPWPSFEGKSQVFVGQVNLAEIAAHDEERVLPKSGLLSFFFAQQWRIGFDPADRGSYAVLFSEDATRVTRREPPADLPQALELPAVGLRTTLEASLAPADSPAVSRARLRERALSAYTDLLETLDDEAERGPPRHRLLGHPDVVQGDMQRECEAVTAGLEAWADTTESARAGASDWRLLLQVDSDVVSGMEWGDVGRLYYWIRDVDLAKRRFERVWGIHQSH